MSDRRPKIVGEHGVPRKRRTESASLLQKRYGYHLARQQARLVRAYHASPVSDRLSGDVKAPAELDLHLLAFSGQRDSAEQLASFRSFVRYAGRPAQVTLGSDGTHTPETLERFRRLFPNIEVMRPEAFVRPSLPKNLRDYADTHPLGKKLAFLTWARPEGRPIFYADADVLFFPGAAALREVLKEDDTHPRYLLDCQRAIDARVVPSDLLEAPPVNSGVWLLHEALPWDEPMALLEALDGPFDFHTEQTCCHVAMHRAGGRPFEPEQYIMQVDDRFRYRTRYERGPIALRHYVSNIRHQFWLNL